MQPYYILRLLPPLGQCRKLQFESIDDLLFTVANLYDHLVLDNLPITDSEMYSWRKDTFNHFCECVVVTIVNPELCLNHEKYFINTPPGKTIPIKSVLFMEPQPKPKNEIRLQAVS